jgi:predicted nucleic acid-binding Zn ribbon protein
VKRRAPRPIGLALAALTAQLEPPSELARIHRVWEEVAGEAIAAHCTPVSLRGGVLRVACDEAVWAAELELLAPDVLPALAASAGISGVASLRCSADRAHGSKNE